MRIETEPYAVFSAPKPGSGANENLRSRPPQKLRDVLVRLTIGLAAYFVLLAIFVWLSKTIAGNRVTVVAGLIALTHIFAVIIAFGVWGRYRRSRL